VLDTIVLLIKFAAKVCAEECWLHHVNDGEDSEDEEEWVLVE